MTSEDSDETLMAAYAKGDSRAFSLLFERYKKRIYGFLLNKLGHSQIQVAEDLLQLSWLKVHQARSDFDAKKKFSTWIFTIAQNSMFDHFKKASTRYEIGDNDLPEFKDAIQEDAETQLLKHESTQRIEWALNKLPPLMKDCVILCEIEEFPTKEAATILGKSDAAIRQNLFKARRLLREILKQGEI